MWPWGHLAVGYLLYSLSCRLSTHRAPTALGTLFVAVGTQFPDLIDKPFAWTFAILPTGRSLMHSVLTASLILGGGWLLTRKYAKRIPWQAFAIGYVSHLAMDSVKSLLNGEVSKLSFLLWPVLPSPSYETQQSFLAHFAELDLSAFVIFQFILTGVAFIVWVADGAPGFRAFRKRKWLSTSN
ncbi:metal-dependent hydrolase [Haladaptatus sp. DFWS20]|uniref:metal-dependent hydrolase n=1 Tax=Haladaptatus sp. DFWS20 TaxID=3403467 RepID=UPI003EBFA885